jgi:hypothetical protein
MKFIYKSVILLLLLVVITACPELDYKHSFKFTNNSISDVFVYLGVVSKELGGSLYPDTSIAEVRCGISFRKNESSYYSYNREYQASDTLCLFVFDADTFNLYNWDEIKAEYKVLRRYDLSLNDFQRLNWQIYYPPNEAMREVKMYPPYKD